MEEAAHEQPRRSDPPAVIERQRRERVMSKDPETDRPQAGAAEGGEQASNSTLAGMAEAWKGAMAPWLAWFGAANPRPAREPKNSTGSRARRSRVPTRCWTR